MKTSLSLTMSLTLLGVLSWGCGAGALGQCPPCSPESGASAATEPSAGEPGSSTGEQAKSSASKTAPMHAGKPVGKNYILQYDMNDLLVEDMEKNLLESWNKRFLIEVSNPYDYDLYSAPVIIKISDLDVVRDEKLVPGSFFVADEKSQKVALSQVDDIDLDKVMDEVVFLANIKAKSTAKYYLYYSEGGRIWQHHTRYTDASALPAWESELFGYRSYTSFILDTFAKPKNNPNLMLRQLYDEQLRQLYHHHTKSDIGMDTLNVGDTSGLAGIVVILDENKKIKPKEGDLKSKVILSGPVRSMVTMTKDPWKTEAGTFTITRTATIYAHHFETQITDSVAVKKGKGKGKLGIGIRKEKVSQYEAMKDKGLFVQWHNQHWSIGEHGIGIYLDPSRITEVGDEVDDQYVLVSDKITGKKDLSVDFVAFGAWKDGGFVTTADEFKEFAEYVKNQQAPVKIKVNDAEVYKKPAEDAAK
jgi:hypothetical protein